MSSARVMGGHHNTLRPSAPASIKGDRASPAAHVLASVVLKRVHRTIEERGLFDPGAHVVIACSGGPDSVALTHILHGLAEALNLKLWVASVDHRLREESKDEVRWVGQFAHALGLPFIPLQVSVAQGASRQNQARNARYEALLRTKTDVGANIVALGHTQDDQAETVILRLLRGSGIQGLAGIHPKRDDGFVRPLIDCTRAEVLGYLERRNLTFVEDPSNEDSRYLRTRVRQDLLPRMEKENPSIKASLSELADEAADVGAVLRTRGQSLLRRAQRHPLQLEIANLLDAESSEQAEALRLWIATFHGEPTQRSHLLALKRALSSRGEVALSNGWFLKVEGPLLMAHRRNGSMSFRGTPETHRPEQIDSCK